MADIKVSALTAATDPTGVDLLGVQGGTSKKINRDVLVGGAAIPLKVSDGKFLSLDGATISATTRNFNWTIGSSPGQNLPGDARQNTIVQYGWNIGPGGSREDGVDANFCQSWEEHYVQGGIGTRAAFEWHVVSTDTSNVSHRGITTFWPKDGGDGSDLGIQMDNVYFGTYAAVKTIKFDNKNKVIQYGPAGMRHQSDTAGFVFQGNTSTVGGFAGNFAVFNCVAASADDALQVIYGPSITGNITAQKIQCPATGVLLAQIYNPSAASSAGVDFQLTTGSATGDATITYGAAGGGAVWKCGIDGSDGDKFKWGGWTLGSDDKMTLDSSANLSIVLAGGGFRVKEGSNCKQGVATLVAGAATVSNTSVTANSRIILTSQSDGGTPGFLRVSSRTAGTSFTITSSSGTDTSVVAYQIFEPA